MNVPSGANTAIMPARALGAPHTTSNVGLPFSISTCTTRSAIGVGVGLRLDDARNREGAELGGRVLDALDLEPDRRQLVGDLGERGLGVEMILEPGQREFHDDSPPESVGTSSTEKP